MNAHGAQQQLRQQAPQQQQSMQGQTQSQRQGVPVERSPGHGDSADPGADGQSIYDVQDEEAREERENVRPPWKERPDSNAM